MTAAYDPHAIARAVLAAELAPLQDLSDRDVAEAAAAVDLPCPDEQTGDDRQWQDIYDAIDALAARVREFVKEEL